VERKRPELLASLAEREEALRERVMGTKVKDLGPLAEEVNEILAAAKQVRGPVPLTIPVRDRYRVLLAPARYRERTDEVELHDAAAGGWSLLDPIPADELTSVVAKEYGIHRDRDPSPTVEEVRDRHAEIQAHLAGVRRVGG
jgi:hypothetical protein